MPDFRVALVGTELVHPTDVLVEIIVQALEPLALSAGKTLNLWHPRNATGAAGAELTLTFVSRSGAPVQMGEQFIGTGSVRLILGDEGGGNVFVGALEELRVGGLPRRGPFQPRAGRGEGPHRDLGRDYFSSVESVFRNGEHEFAEAAANIALHEAGHIIAALPHSTDVLNYMVTGLVMPLGDWRNRENVRRFWSCPKTFNAIQTAELAARIASGSFAGGMTISSSPGSGRRP